MPHVGHVSNGARRWLSFGSWIAVEPSELVKLGLIIYLSIWLTIKGERVRDFKACFVPFSLIVGMIALLLLKQPDLGTAIVIAVTALTIYFVAGASLTQLGLACLGASTFAYMLMNSAGYRHDRLTVFLHPFQDPTGVGYHIIQALVALRYGGLFGQGLGNGTQKAVLPAPHTDSILAVIGEEWGLIGTLFVLFLFLLVAYRGMRVAATAPDTFGRLLATGITCWIVFQALLNFAVITSSVPFTGVPLPFVSYGGTSLVITMAAMGILLNISRHASGGGFARQDAHHGRGNGRARVPGVVHHPLPAAVDGARGRARIRPGGTQRVPGQRVPGAPAR
jgi:cell division protein FtsW